MPRRRNTGYAISLFAFQDIITSVSGVLIMVVLLLAVELTQRTLGAADKATRAGVRETAAQMESEKRRLAAESVELEAAVQQAEGLIRRATDAPSGLIDEKIRSERAAAEAVRSELGELGSAAEELGRAENELRKGEARAESSDRERRAVEKRMAEVKAAIEKRKNDRRVRYAAPRGITPERAWVCEVSDAGLAIGLMEGEDELHRIPVSIASLDIAWAGTMESLLSWIRARKPPAEYILFLIRPSGSPFSKLLTKRTGQLPFQLGMELIGEEEAIERRPKGALP